MARVLLALVLGLALAPARVRAAENLAGQDLSGRDLTAKDLDGANLRGAILKGAKLSGLMMTNADLRGADMTNAWLDQTDLTGADLRGATMIGVHMINTKLVKANLEGVTLYLGGAAAFTNGLQKLDLMPSTMGLISYPHSDGLSLRGANLKFAKILGNLEAIDLRHADLRGANLSEADKVNEALLGGATYDSGTRWNIDPEEARAVRGEEARPAQKADSVAGKWFLIRKGTEDLKVLKILDSGDYEWDVSESAPLIKGKWRQATGSDLGTAKSGIVLQKGQSDKDWLAVPGAPEGKRGTLDLKQVGGSATERYARED